MFPHILSVESKLIRNKRSIPGWKHSMTNLRDTYMMKFGKWIIYAWFGLLKFEKIDGRSKPSYKSYGQISKVYPYIGEIWYEPRTWGFGLCWWDYHCLVINGGFDLRSSRVKDPSTLLCKCPCIQWMANTRLQILLMWDRDTINHVSWWEMKDTWTHEVFIEMWWNAMIIVVFLSLMCDYILDHLKSLTCGKDVWVTRSLNEGDGYKESGWPTLGSSSREFFGNPR